MIDLIKKSLLSGIGAAVITKDKVEAAMQDFIREGKVTTADAKIMAEKIAEQGRKEFDDMVSKLGTKLREATAKTDETLHARLKELEERIGSLEAKHHTKAKTRAGEP